MQTVLVNCGVRVIVKHIACMVELYIVQRERERKMEKTALVQKSIKQFKLDCEAVPNTAYYTYDHIALT